MTAISLPGETRLRAELQQEPSSQRLLQIQCPIPQKDPLILQELRHSVAEEVGLEK